jgi:hypothetical protein
MRYDHLVHAIALSRAGYTPHLCSFSIASIDMLFYVVPKVGSWAIFYDGLDPTLAAAMVRATKFPVPVGTLVDPFAIHIPNWEDEALVSLNRPPRDLGFILHTTSSDGQGLGPAHQHAPPAPVEITFSDLHAAVSKELRSNAEYGHQLSSTSDIVLMSYGCAQLQGLHCELSLATCEATSTHRLTPSLGINTASFLRRCIVIPSRPPRPSELAGLIRAQSINRLILSSSALQPFFREAQSNEAIVRAFRQLRQIRVHGTDIPSECVNWMLERNVPLVVLGAR